MIKNYRMVILFMVVIMFTLGCSPVKEIKNAEVLLKKETVIKSINQTGYNVIELLYNKDRNKNLLFSPISMTSALSMLENGASGITQAEMLKVMNIDRDSGLNEVYKQLINEFNNISNKEESEEMPVTTINMANSIWLRNADIKIKQSYIDKVKSFYDGDIFSVDFRKTETKDDMNKWIEDKTNGLLRETIKETNDLDVAYLMNTLYFKGSWINPFNINETKSENFLLENDEKVKVDMMHSVKSRSYFESKNVQIVALDYPDASMFVVLPKDNIKNFIKKYDYKDIEEMINETESKEVDLYFPKFKFSNNNDLVEILKSLGMSSAFDSSTAEFLNMIESPPPAAGANKAIDSALVSAFRLATRPSASSASRGATTTPPTAAA